MIFVGITHNSTKDLIASFNLINLSKTTAVAFLACEARGDEGAHNLKREFEADDARAQTKHVAIVMLAGLVRRVCVTA